jgi:hypothetical protein
MRVVDHLDSEGRVAAFEISNALVGRADVCVLVRRAGAIVRRIDLRPFGGREEFCEFELDGRRFVASEPFSDSDAYWVGSHPPRSSPELLRLRATFEASRPPMWPSAVRAASVGSMMLGTVLVLGGVAVPSGGVVSAGLVLAVGGVCGYRSLRERLRR